MKVICDGCKTEQDVPKSKGAYNCVSCRKWSKIETVSEKPNERINEKKAKWF